jgi:hypothetical protein
MNRLILDRERPAVGRSVLGLAALAAVLLLMLPAPARAQVTVGPEMMYIGSGLCVAGTASVSTYAGYLGLPYAIGANSAVSTFSSCPTAVVARQYSPACLWPYQTGCVPNIPKPPQPQPWVVKTMPVGWLAIAQDLYLDTNGTKTFCMHLSTWVYNTTAVSSATIISAAGAACGMGNYGVNTGVYAWDGANWQGGWFYTGDVYLF